MLGFRNMQEKLEKLCYIILLNLIQKRKKNFFRQTLSCINNSKTIIFSIIKGNLLIIALNLFVIFLLLVSVEQKHILLSKKINFMLLFATIQ